MAASPLQSASAQGTAASLSATLASTPTLGNTLVLIANSNNLITPTGTWTAQFHRLADQDFYIWTRPVVASDTKVFTVTPASADYLSIVVVELAGVTSTPFDVVGTAATANNATTLAAPAITTTAAGDLILAVFAQHGYSGTVSNTFTFSNGFTSVAQALTTAAANSNSTSLVVASKVQATAGSSGATSATWVSQAQNVAGVQIAFKAGTAATAPSTNAGPDQANVEPYGTVTLTATDTAGTNPITSAAWSQVAGSPAVTLTGTNPVTFVAPGTIAGASLTFRRTVSDGTLSGSDDVVVSILPVAERLVVGGAEVPMQIKVVQ